MLVLPRFWILFAAGACSFAACSLAAASLATAQEWTRFRGPNGNGESETVFAAETPKEKWLWRAELPGVGHSSPVLWGDRVFVLSADGETAKRYLLCLHATDGKEIWRRDFPGVKHHLHGLSSFASCTPAVDANRVYVAWSDPDKTVLVALNHNGEDVWAKDFGPWVSQHGFGNSPMLCDDLVVLCCYQEDPKRGGGGTPSGSFVVAVDQKSGEVRWKTPRQISNTSYSVPCLHKKPDGSQELLCCSTAEGLFSLDPKTGLENWSEKVFALRTVSSPFIVDDLVIGTTGQGGGSSNMLAAISLDGKHRVVYEHRKQAPYVPTPVAKGDLLFLWSDAGVVTCLEVKTGKVVWQERVGGQYYGSPIRAGDKIYCSDTAGNLICIAAERKFQKLGETKLGETSHSTPAIAGGVMYVRTVSHLIAIDGQKAGGQKTGR
jgi:outer membrane protein assembly factor BamB